MDKLDEMIADALKREEAGALPDLKEPGWFALGLSQFTGTYGWVTWVVMAVQVALFAVGVWCAFGFFAAGEVLEAVRYGIPGAVLILMATSLKLSLMPQMQADRVIREVKRLELMVLQARRER